MDIDKEVRDILAKVAGTPADEIKPEMDLVGGLGIDSPKALQLLVSLEERFDIEIEDDDAAKLDSVDDILRYLESRGLAEA